MTQDEICFPDHFIFFSWLSTKKHTVNYSKNCVVLLTLSSTRASNSKLKQIESNAENSSRHFHVTNFSDLPAADFLRLITWANTTSWVCMATNKSTDASTISSRKDVFSFNECSKATQSASRKRLNQYVMSLETDQLKQMITRYLHSTLNKSNKHHLNGLPSPQSISTSNDNIKPIDELMRKKLHNNYGKKNTKKPWKWYNKKVTKKPWS